MKKLLILFVLFSNIEELYAATAYQVTISAGMDNVRTDENRGAGTYGQFKISTLGPLLRLHSAFTALNGTQYMEGEVAMGLSFYLLTPFISKHAPVFPFVFAEGTFGVGRLDLQERQDMGFGYGAGVDLKLTDKGGVSFGMGLQSATENTVRYQLGFYWMVSN